mgnify:CR=1 FL=1
MLYWPCIVDKHGKVREKLSREPMSYNDAEALTKRIYRNAWFRLETMSQAITHPYFANDPETVYWLLKDETAS